MYEGDFDIPALRDIILIDEKLRGHNIVIASIAGDGSHYATGAAASTIAEKAIYQLPIQLVFDIGIPACLARLKSAYLRVDRDFRLGDVLVVSRNEKGAAGALSEIRVGTDTGSTVSSSKADLAGFSKYYAFGCIILDRAGLCAEGSSFTTYLQLMPTNMKSKYPDDHFERLDDEVDILYYSYDGDDDTEGKIVGREGCEYNGPRA